MSGNSGIEKHGTINFRFLTDHGYWNSEHAFQING
jgi:hypothetical protein